jgi:O-antigen/teichoic acid export membrane protein
MVSGRKTLFETIIYGLGGIFTSIIGYVLLPIYTRVLAVDVYGVNELLASISTIGIYILSMGVASALVKCYVRDCESDRDRSELVSTSILLSSLVAGGILIPLALFGIPLSRMVLGSANYATAMTLNFTWTFLMILNALPLQVFRSERKPIPYVIATLLQPLFSGVLNILFLVHWHLGVTGIYLGNTIAALAIAIIYIPWMLKRFGFRLSPKAARLLLSFGVPLVPASLLIWVMNLSNRYFLLGMTSLEQVGLYSLGYKVAMIIQVFLVAPFSLAWPPIMYNIASQPNAKTVYAKALNYYALFGMLVVAGLVSLSSDLIHIMAAPSYAEAARVVPLTALAFFLYGANFALMVGIHLTNKNKYYPIGNLIGALLNVGLNVLLIPYLGVLGSAMGTFIAYIGLTAYTYWLSNRYYPVPYEWGRLIRTFGVGFLVMGVTPLIHAANAWVSMGIKALAVVGIYTLGVLLLHIVSYEEWQSVKKLILGGLAS